MCSDPGTNHDGKGNLTSAEFSAWTNKCQWWNTETDRSEAWLLHFSTQGISTDVLSMQVAMQNRIIGGPRYIRVDWSEHGDNNRDDWNPITEFQVPDIVNWNYTLYWQWRRLQVHQRTSAARTARQGRRMHPLLGREQESRRQGRRRVRRPDHHHRRDRLLLHRRTLQQITLSGSPPPANVLQAGFP